jgi:hypothetical protein
MSFGTCETVRIVADNEEGFSVCNADSVPEDAELFVDGPKEPKTKADFQVALKALGAEFDAADNKDVLVELYKTLTTEQ